MNFYYISTAPFCVDIASKIGKILKKKKKIKKSA